MKQYPVIPVHQKSETFYILVADPRLIVDLIPQAAPGEEQENQRPWDIRRAREIANYVSGKFKEDPEQPAKGLLPNAPILNIKESLKIEQNEQGQYFLLLPERDNPAELTKFEGVFEILDGQHRVRAFGADVRSPDLSDYTTYNMVFTVFDRIGTDVKKEVFTVVNEKQKGVPPTLLRNMKRSLNLLGGDEPLWDFNDLLNREDYSPLKGRIQTAGARVPNGYSEKALSSIWHKSGAWERLKALTDSDSNRMSEIVSNYLQAWAQEAKFDFQKPSNADARTKISGLRFMLGLFTTVADIMQNSGIEPNTNEFRKVLGQLAESLDIDSLEELFIDEENKKIFASETATNSAVVAGGQKLRDSFTGQSWSSWKA